MSTINHSEIKSRPNINFDALDNYPINQKECLCVLDVKQSEVIYAKGFYDVFGCSDDDIKHRFVINKCHPDDKAIVYNIIRSSVIFSQSNPGSCAYNKLFLCLRLRKQDGSYGKYLCKFSANLVDTDGRLKNVLLLITDISFMDNSDSVKWNFEATHLNKSEFRSHIYKQYQDFFTGREIEVIKEVCKNVANQEIAKNLFISKHTVTTHRKNIYRKSNCHSIEELKQFIKGIGINMS